MQLLNNELNVQLTAYNHVKENIHTCMRERMENYESTWSSLTIDDISMHVCTYIHTIAGYVIASYFVQLTLPTSKTAYMYHTVAGYLPHNVISNCFAT